MNTRPKADDGCKRRLTLRADKWRYLLVELVVNLARKDEAQEAHKTKRTYRILPGWRVDQGCQDSVCKPHFGGVFFFGLEK
jgi:hypothetical protein